MKRAVISPTKKRAWWVLVEPYAWRWVVVPKGFRTDGATIPWPLTLVLPRLRTDYFEPALVHDYLLRKRREGQSDLSRDQIDRWFRLALGDAGVKRPLRDILYWGVALYGIVAERGRYWR